MYTLGYAFRPWEEPKAIADGPSILRYIEATAREGGIDQHIRFGHRVTRASWSTPDARWTVEAELASGETVRLTCYFLFMCSGYYRYEAGYTPDFAGADQFAGRIVHPQVWPEGFDYTGQRVVVIGSGATAVTLVPAMAKTAAHVTMLQRSPTYVVARPAEDAIANAHRRWLPAKAAYALTRWKQVLLGMYIFRLCRRSPERAKRLILSGVRMALGRDYDVQKHFTPRYNPWDQRLCLVPDGDLFEAIQSGKASMVTDEIDTFNASGIRLKSGQQLDTDLIVTATGLQLQVLGGMQITVDGAPVDMAQTLSYKGCMYSGVPNLASAFGYTNASWTLKADLTCEYVCRLLNHMRSKGLRQATPGNTDPTLTTEPLIDFSSGYVQRAQHLSPKQGSRAPWKLYQNYPKDILLLRYGRVDDGVLQFTPP